MRKGPGIVVIAWAEDPFSPPSLKWTAMVTPLLDELPTPEVRNAEDVRAMQAFDLGAAHVAVADER